MVVVTEEYYIRIVPYQMIPNKIIIRTKRDTYNRMGIPGFITWWKFDYSSGWKYTDEV